MTRALVGLESVLQHSVVYCNREGWQQGAVYCNTLHCIVAGRAVGGKVVSQYNLEYCGRRRGCPCRKAGSCVATRRWALGWGALGAQGARQAHDTGAGAGASVGHAGGRREGVGSRRERRRADTGPTQSRGARQAGVAGRRHGRATGRITRGRRAAQALGARGGQGCALGALGLFLARFDSVLFLSQFFDIIREPGS